MSKNDLCYIWVLLPYYNLDQILKIPKGTGLVFTTFIVDHTHLQGNHKVTTKEQ